MIQPGHNAAGAGQLRALVERIERLEEEKRATAELIKEVYAEAKANGFDTRTLRKVISLRKKTPEDRQEEAALLDLYLGALGMLADTPLGAAAIAASGLGEPAPLTPEEQAAGVTAAWVDRKGTRCTLTPSSAGA